eukprot:gene3844-2724_t
MGIPLPKPVLTHIQEKDGNEIFRCGSSCVNGYRDSMEDAHLVYLEKTWGFFGVFDGHINDQCSTHLEGAWRQALDEEKKRNNIPMTDDRMKEIAMKIDKEWLESDRDGGSTGTFFLALKKDNNVHLQVGNVGDSRVVACINGKCQPLTEDHKPNNTEERYRIEACGGRVENNRVDGSLAVSRAFGDKEYKRSAVGPAEQKVIALPDVTHADVTFNAGDFVALCCDGVFEGNFSNEEVIDFIKENLESSNDLPEIAGRVCEEAILRGSRDNISCVIVQFADGLDYSKEPHLRLVPGPFDCPSSNNFRKVYEMMARKGHSTIGAVLESRYDYLVEKDRNGTLTADEKEEMQVFNEGPGPNLSGADRTAYFTELFEKLNANTGNSMDGMERFMLDNPANVPLPLLLSLLQNSGGLGGGNGGDQKER